MTENPKVPTEPGTASTEQPSERPRAAGRYPAAFVIAAIVLLISIATFYR